jgi:hypothetical protein
LIIDDKKVAEIDLKGAKKVVDDGTSALYIPFVAINPLNGKHQLSLRFKNEKAGTNKLFSIRGIELKSK